MTTSISTNRFFSIDKLFLLVFGFIFLFQLYRFASSADNFFFVDLRNRVIGARLIDQGISPYFFKWDPSYPETLRDPIDICTIKNNMITIPPSVLVLMKPLANLSYTNICRIWVFVHFAFFLLIMIPLYFICENRASKVYLFTAAGILLFSDQWTLSLVVGQTHFIFPAIISSIIVISFTKWKYRYLCIGFLIAIISWIRPNASIIFPIIFLCTSVNKKQLLTGFVSTGLLLVSGTLIAGHQNYWIDFFHSCKEWINNYNNGTVLERCSYPSFVDGKKVIHQAAVPGRMSDEINNFPNVFRKIIGSRKMLPQFAWVFVIAYIATLYYYFKKRESSFTRLLITGMLLYWLSEMVAPIYRHSYYYVELFGMVLFFATIFDKLKVVEKTLLILSLLLIFADFLTMNLTCAEYCLIACMASYVYNKKRSAIA